MKILNNSKLLLKIFSTLIAVVLWFAVTYTEDPSINQHIGNLDKVFTGESVLAEKGLIIVNKDDLQSLSVTVRGRRSNVINALDNVTASVDVSRITEAGTHEVPVDYLYPSNLVMLTKARYSTIAVTAEKLVTREVPIRIKSTQNKKAKDQIIELESTVSSVKVTGAQSYVGKISYALVEINEADISTNGTTNYSYKLYDKDGTVWDDQYMTSKSPLSVPVTHNIYKKSEIPVKVILYEGIAQEYALTVKKQSAETLTVGSIDGVLPEALYAVITEDLLDVQGSVTLNIRIPDNIYLKDDSATITAEFEIEPKSVHYIEVPVTFENLPEDKVISVDTKKVRVHVQCAKDDAKADNISAILDASELEEGVETTVILEILAEENIDVHGVYAVNAVMQ